MSWRVITHLMLRHRAGAHWSLMPALTSELFGLQHFASNYSLVQVCPLFFADQLQCATAVHLGRRARELPHSCTCLD